MACKHNPSNADRARAASLRAANPEMAAAMAEIRRSSAAGVHTDKHAEARKGHNVRGSRAGAKAKLKRNWEI